MRPETIKHSYLALDLGAESGRAMLANLASHNLDLVELHRFANIPVRLPTGLYWDTLRLFHEMCDGIRAAACAVDTLDGIAVDTWGVDFGLLGEDGSLLDHPRHYRDARTRGAFEEVFARVPRAEIFRQTGVQFMEINSLYHLYAAQRDSPRVLNIASHLLFMPDLFNYFLTGAFTSERTIASTSQFYDPVKKQFATDMLRRLGIAGGFLTTLTDPGTELGPVLPHVAEHCNLTQDVPVYTTGSHDTASAVAAVPASGLKDWCYISSGTWSLMGVELDEPVINDAALEANFTNEVGVQDKIRFLKNIPGLWVLQECRRAWAREGSEYSYAELMERAAAAKASSTVLDLDEFVSPGNHPQRIQEYCRKTAQEAPGDVGAVTRLILYSLAVRYKQVLALIEQLTGRQINVIHIVGGGSRNSLLNQLAADVTGRRVIAGPAEATAAGNALIQAMGMGHVGSLQELRAIVRNSFEVEEFRPLARKLKSAS
ncbi:MAG TPA: rhamnulokinase family protein [Bryobacteraceae bacterium]|nr:rhamnulokinase family protein [Bryobacteraceae bacterium]